MSSSSRPAVSRRDPSPGASGGAGEVHVVANRLPITWSDEQGWTRAPGGLVTVLDGLIRRRRLGWFGSAATLRGAPEPPPATCWSGSLHLVHVDEALGAGAITGCANGALWPALHGFGELVEHHAAWWTAYVGYNLAFAAAVANGCDQFDRVWVHDYHLLLLPELLARRRPDLRVGLSLHTPVDRPGLARLPNASVIARALRRTALIGVQTTADATSLRGWLDDLGDEDGNEDEHVPRGAEPGGPPTRPEILVSPVSIDPDEIVDAVRAPATEALRRRWRRRAAGRRLVVGVDRLDYTKGIVPRLRAFDVAFARGWLDPAETLVVQVAQPSRTDVPAYRDLHAETERVAHELRCRWTDREGEPAVELLVASLDRREVIALLAEADVAVVTPVRDGMNLVSKEFCVANEGRGGVLVLSRGAGAADELGADAVLVDGDDPSSVAAGLRRADALDDGIRREMAARRARRVRAWSATHWSSTFLGRLAAQPLSRETS